MSDSVRPYGQQPTRLLCPWNSPGKRTGVGCHFLLPGTVGGPAINTTGARQFSPENVKPLTLEPYRWGDQEAQAANGGHADAGAVRGNETEVGGRQASGEKQNPGQMEGGGGENTTQGQKRQNRERETSTSRQIEQQVLGLASCLKPPKCAQNIQ